jgi:hypothetical protein
MGLTLDEIAELSRLASELPTESLVAQLPQWNRGGPPYKAAITVGSKGVIANVLDWRIPTKRGINPIHDTPPPLAVAICALLNAVPKLLAQLEAAEQEWDRAD